MRSNLVAINKSVVCFFVVCFFILSAGANAAKFANQFCEFELPPGWLCNLEGAEWVCQSSDTNKKRDAIIVLAAKLKGDQDSLDQYLVYLKAPKSYTSVQGKPVKSEPKYAKTININNHSWVDSLHLESEIPGFYTRYLATIKQDIGVLVTYSINKDKYTEYLKIFETMVRTLKVFRKEGGINVKSQKSNLFDTTIPQGISEGTVFPGASPEGGSDQTQGKRKGGLPIIPIALIGAAVVLLLILKRKKKG